MLKIEIVNVNGGLTDNAHYRYVVRVNEEVIARGSFDGHNRADGWTKLVRAIAKQNECANCGQVISNHPNLMCDKFDTMYCTCEKPHINNLGMCLVCGYPASIKTDFNISPA